MLEHKKEIKNEIPETEVVKETFHIDENQIEEAEFQENYANVFEDRKSPEAPSLDVEEEIEMKIDPNILREQRTQKEREAFLDAEKIAQDLRKAEEEEIIKQKTIMGSMEGQARNILDKYR